VGTKGKEGPRGRGGGGGKKGSSPRVSFGVGPEEGKRKNHRKRKGGKEGRRARVAPWGIICGRKERKGYVWGGGKEGVRGKFSYPVLAHAHEDNA